MTPKKVLPHSQSASTLTCIQSRLRSDSIYEIVQQWRQIGNGVFSFSSLSPLSFVLSPHFLHSYFFFRFSAIWKSIALYIDKTSEQFNQKRKEQRQKVHIVDSVSPYISQCIAFSLIKSFLCVEMLMWLPSGYHVCQFVYCSYHCSEISEWNECIIYARRQSFVSFSNCCALVY